MPESQPLPDSASMSASTSFAIVTAGSGTDNHLAAASSVTENRREALYRRRPVQPDRPSTQAGRQLLSPTRAASRSSASVAQPDWATTTPHPKAMEST